MSRSTKCGAPRAGTRAPDFRPSGGGAGRSPPSCKGLDVTYDNELPPPFALWVQAGPVAWSPGARAWIDRWTRK